MRIARRIAAAMALCAVVGALTSCGKKEEQAPTPQQTTNTAPTTPIEQPRLRPSDLNLAEGVQFPIERIPANESAARAVASLANAIAQGDSEALRSMLDRADVGVLEFLVSTGAWAESTDAATVVRVCALEATDNTMRVGLGIEDPSGAYLLGWRGEESRGAWRFAAIPVASPPAAQASDLDGASLQDMTSPTSN